jgi:hypothetical protein
MVRLMPDIIRDDSNLGSVTIFLNLPVTKAALTNGWHRYSGLGGGVMGGRGEIGRPFIVPYRRPWRPNPQPCFYFGTFYVPFGVECRTR